MWQWLSVLFLTCTLSVRSSPLAPSNSISLTDTNEKLTDISQIIANLSAEGIPTDFKLDPQFGPIPTRLPEQLYYYSAIMAMSEVALGDWEGVMQGRTFSTARYPQLVIRMNTRYETIPRKYVVWALLLACGFMEHALGFGFIFFSLQWQGREVGGLAFDPQGRSAALIPKGRTNKTERTAQNEVISIDKLTDSTATLSETISQIGLTLPLNNDIVTVALTRIGGPLRPFEVFTVILGALFHAAPMPKGRRITSTWKSELEDNDDVHAEFYTSQQPSSRSEPPHYTFQLLIETLVLATDLIIARNQYYAIGMITKVNDIAIASSTIIQKRGPVD